VQVQIIHFDDFLENATQAQDFSPEVWKVGASVLAISIPWLVDGA
jgi:hypothetical protein